MGIFDFLKSKNIKNDNGLNEIYYNYGRGAIKGIFFLKNGKMEGIGKEYYESGQLKNEVNWSNGKLEGVCKIYFESGQLKYHMTV